MNNEKVREFIISEVEGIEKEIENINNKMKKLIEKQGINCIEKLNKLNEDKKVKQGQVFKLYGFIEKLNIQDSDEVEKQEYVYRLNMSYEDENMEDGLGWDNEYIISNNKYSKNEFEDICANAVNKCRDKNNSVEIFGVVDILKSDYAFKTLEIENFFDFEEE